MTLFNAMPWFVAQLDPTPSWEQFAQLGVIALAMIVGAGAVFRWGVIRAEKRYDAETAAARAFYDGLVAQLRSERDRERDDRLKAEERERSVREATMEKILPNVLESNRLLGELALSRAHRREG